MSYLGVLEAVRGRLEGRDPQFVPSFPSLEKLTKRDLAEVPKAEPNQRGKPARVPTSFNSTAVASIGGDRHVSFDVPIFRFDIEGRYFNQNYASLTYEVIAYEPRYEEFVWSQDAFGGDVYCEPVIATTETVVDNIDGEDLGESVRMIRQREVEHPFDIMIELRAYAKDPVQSALLVKWVYENFPPRHYIRVPMMDGTFRSWDLLFQSYSDIDKREAVRSGTPGIEREYAKVWTYNVEGYLDNTDMTRLVHLTRQRIIQQQNMEASG